jgi:hypothetical protein
MKKLYFLASSILMFILLFLAVTNCIAQEVAATIPWKSAYKKSDSKVKRYSNTYTFHIKFKNDFAASYLGEIRFDAQKNSYFLECKEGSIYPPQTLSISRIMDTDTIIGFPSNNMWLFQVDSGAISTYSVYAEKADIYVNYIKKNPDTTLHELTDIFIRKDLSLILNDDPVAVKYLNKSYRKLLFRNHGSLVLGLSLIAVAASAPKGSTLSVASWLAIPVAISIPFFVKPPSPLDVIRFYNTRKLLASIN